MPQTPVRHNPDSVRPASGNYSHGVEVGGQQRLLFVSGQIPEDWAGEIPVGFEAQAAQVWANIGEVLASAGMDFTNIVKGNTSLTDSDQIEMNGQVRQRVLGISRPALTVVFVRTLNPVWLLKVEVTAVS